MVYITPSFRRAVRCAQRPRNVHHDDQSRWRRLSPAMKAGIVVSGLAVTAMVFSPSHALSNNQPTPAKVSAPAPVRAAPQTPVAAEAAAAAAVTDPAMDAALRPAPRPPVIASVAANGPMAQIATPATEVQRGPVTRLPIPRYVSLKGGEGNVRRGPSLSHRIDWVFRHAGMPLRVVGEFGHWRRVENRDGAGGWVHYQLLSGVRTAIIQQDTVELRARPDLNAGIIAMAEGGAIVKLGECEAGWCRVSGSGAKGWLPKAAIWGIDMAELRD